MDDHLRRVLLMVAGLLFLTLLISTLLIAFGRDGEEIVDRTPREVFDAHLAALDAGEWELSDTYTKDECTFDAQGGSEVALQAVLDEGFSYRRTFQIEDVWINEDGTEAILELQTPPELPPVAVLDLVDGEWLIAC